MLNPTVCRFFKCIVDSVPLLRVYILELQNLCDPQHISIRKVMAMKAKSSGAVMSLCKTINHSKSVLAWLTNNYIDSFISFLVLVYSVHILNLSVRQSQLYSYVHIPVHNVCPFGWILKSFWILACLLQKVHIVRLKLCRCIPAPTLILNNVQLKISNRYPQNPTLISHVPLILMRKWR